MDLKEFIDFYVINEAVSATEFNCSTASHEQTAINADDIKGGVSFLFQRILINHFQKRLRNATKDYTFESDTSEILIRLSLH